MLYFGFEMKKTAVVFGICVFLPSFVLGVMALHMASEQRFIIERQTFVIHRKQTEEIAALARELIDEQRHAFTSAVEQLLAQEDPATLAPQFSERLTSRWPRARVGFAVTLDGQLLSPTAEQSAGRPQWQQFLASHSAFLSNAIPAEIYQAPTEVAKAPPSTQQKWMKVANAPGRQVEPQAFLKPSKGLKQADMSNVSQLAQWSTDFRSVVSVAPSGTISRFAQDRLEILFWFRPARSPQIVFGALLGADALADLWAPLLASNRGEDPNVCLAILNERARPVARSIPSFATNWSRPFAATEIGEVLPHWEAALYLTNPAQLAKTARLSSLTLILLIFLAFGVIAWGGYLVAVDTRRQLALAQRKTDFVSNVSHELKSPLTSIRMFAELLQQNRVTDPAQRSEYLRIITVEAERLTRLINNVLDFAKLERNQKQLDKHPLDLYPVIKQTWEAYATHLHTQGFTTAWNAAPPPYRVTGDSDALAQILVNLLSNAEKYSGNTKDVTLHTYFENSHLCIEILDRGLGVPPGHEEKIFEPFHRAHDALSSGIQGTGLGLTLASRLASEHGGAITYGTRQGGGSSFTLRLPAAPPPGSEPA